MAIFGKEKSGGLMNMIRCDEENYMIWKWRPEGQDANSTKRENSIRWGSSLRVKDGEVAVFVYKQKDGTMQDFIEGPFDEIIKTKNFPILASIVGLAYGGDTPFQAEVYFINLQGNNQLKFGVPYFDVFDPRFPDLGVPMSVRGTITFSISDYKNFIKLNRLVNFDHDQFRNQIKDALIKYVKGVVVNLPSEAGMPVMQMERKILEINERVEDYLKPRIEGNFGVTMKGFDIEALSLDKESECYKQLWQLTAGNTARTVQAQADLNIENIQQAQRLNLKNMEETMRIQREEAQRAQRLQTEEAHIAAHALDQQTEVLKAGVQNLGQMGTINMGGSGGTGGAGGGLNPAAAMTGMAMGGALGQQMAQLMRNMGQNMQPNQSQQLSVSAMPPQMTTPPPLSSTPPPMPNVSFFASVNNQQVGPLNMQQIQQMVQSGQITPNTMVWKQGMSGWEPAGSIVDLQTLFGGNAGNSSTPPPLV